VVHSSEGRLQPAAPDLLSEVAIICRIARATLGHRTRADWKGFEANYDHIRNHIEAVLPDFKNYNQRVRQAGGFYLSNAVKQRQFKTASGKASFSINPLNPIALQPDQLLLQTFRSHDQFNTTIYGNNDRYRGIQNERRVLFMHPEDMAERGIQAEQPIDITSHFQGQTRHAELFLAIPYATPRGCAAAYFPEANVLIPLQSQANISGTPTSKSVVITIAASQCAGTAES